MDPLKASGKTLGKDCKENTEKAGFHLKKSKK